MIRTDPRSRRVAVVPDFLVNPGSALYGKAYAPPTNFLDAVMAQGWGLVKLPPHVASAASCATLVEVAVGDILDYRKNGYDVVIVAIEGLPQQGVWLDAMTAHFDKRKAPLPPVLTIGLDVTPMAADALEKLVPAAA